MDYGRDTGYSSGNVVQVLSGNSGNGVSGSWGRGLADQAVWATEDEYRVWSREASVDTNANYEVRTSQSQSGSDKKSRNSQVDDVTTASNRSRAIGKMFHKTKLCCKFRAGTCPYITNCNFAHGMEELRKPPPNWQDIVAAHEEERTSSMEPREEFQIPSVAEVESQRSYKGRHCKKFYSEEGCPYGDNCTYLHDEQSKARESDAISLGPGTGGGYNGSSAGSVLKPSNWKTRICNKWETTGYCPFGSKCHFAHGAEELHRYGGTLPESEVKGCCTPVETKQGGVTPKHAGEAFVGVGVGAAILVPHSDSFHMGVPSQRGSNLLQRTGQRPNLKRKGPDRISKVYGDWIEDL